MCKFVTIRELQACYFADDFVGVSDSREKSQKFIDVVHNRWRLKVRVQ